MIHFIILKMLWDHYITLNGLKQIATSKEL